MYEKFDTMFVCYISGTGVVDDSDTMRCFGCLKVGKCWCFLALRLNYEVLFWRIEATHSILDLHSVVVDDLQDSVMWEIKSVGNQWQRPQIHRIL